MNTLRRLLIVPFLIFSFNSDAKIVHVAAGGSGDGGSWDSPVGTIANGVAAATSGDQIWIASGTYHESVTLKPSLSLYGGFTGNETNVNQRNLSVNTTTIDGSAAHTSVILGATGTISDGLRITGGISTDGGGGLRCENAIMLLRNCRIDTNTSTSSGVMAYGGGIFCVSSNLTLHNCLVEKNFVWIERLQNQAVVDRLNVYGAGICAIGSSVQLVDCHISDNTCSSSSELGTSRTVFSIGGGLYVEGVAECKDCDFSRNEVRAVFSGDASYARGGGIGINGTLTLNQCVVKNNKAEVPINTSGAYAEGGGIYSEGFLQMWNSLLMRNSVYVWSIDHIWDLGGDSISFKGDSNIVSSTIFTGGCGALLGPAAIRGKTGVLTMRNSITGTLNNGLSPIEYSDVAFSNILGGFPGEGNINLDPQFVDPQNCDFRLLASSPCIDAGTTTGPLTDIIGKPRPVDVPGMGREGAGAFDMGAYEFQLSDLPTPTPTATVTRTPAPSPTRTEPPSMVRDWAGYD